MLEYVELNVGEVSSKNDLFEIDGENSRSDLLHTMSAIENQKRQALKRVNPATKQETVHSRKRVEGKDYNDRTTWGRVGRNDPCPCGSGKKYKHCCGKE